MSTRNQDFIYRDGSEETFEQRQARFGDVGGPVSYLNPTHALFYDVQTRAFEKWTNETKHTCVQLPKGCRIAYKWTSRNNRKGVHALALGPMQQPFERLLPPHYRSSYRWILHGLHCMATCFPYWDLSYLIAILSTAGSVLWLTNGLLMWAPLAYPDTTLPGQVVYGGGILAFCAVLVFLATNCLLILEAVNDRRAQCFGWRVQEQPSYNGAPVVIIRPGNCQHYHSKKDYFVGHEENFPSPANISPASSAVALVEKISDRAQIKQSWLPTWEEFWRHYCRELGFLAAIIQLAATTIYCLASIPRLPGIYEHLTPLAKQLIMYAPKGCGGILVATSACLTMLESQTYWLVPRPQAIGWQIGFWSFAGAVGFMIGSWLAFCSDDWATNQSALATIWGSSCFLIASLMAWYESLAKFPITTEDVGTWAEADQAENETQMKV